ncbi:fasciclin domain-containing protein [Hyunsoonleella sp. SJ7]|uniref:Fasciclin domain-containing protein n=1 Tax=Hyunsoonleella aquatilis TaxID=2762758 RepID=A0A923KH05_9FLAO|nr:fasciclin domain-containing protein [Hyunsoonleella aquatilis]MBC3759441.1 fasciclin domain-containing protein [Hyunsoonleella aquatilis]
MNALKILKKLALSLLAVTFLVSCDLDDDNTVTFTPETIAEIAQASPGLTTLVQALQRANLVGTLDGPGQFTVFAPSNTAFDAFLTANNFSSINDVPVDVLTQVLLNHVIDGEFPSSSLSTSYIKTLATQEGTGLNLSMFVDLSSGVTLNGVSNVDLNNANIDATNGIIHVVDAVIGLPTIATLATANSNFSTLTGALTPDLVTVLSSPGTMTVLAPDNNAFSNLPAIPSGDALVNTLLNHVIGDIVQASDIIGAGADYTNTLATGPNDANISLYYRVVDDAVVFNGMSTVTAPDIVATNGIIHGISEVITIPTVVTFALADPNFSTLVTALTTLTPGTPFEQVLARTEGGNGDMLNPPFTVFAPVNDAFAAITVPEESVLTQVLLHHVVGGANVQSGDLDPSQTVAPTLQGQSLTINLPGTNGNIADVTDGAENSDIGIVAVDVQAGNGVIHVLNKVALPNLD